MDQRKEHNPVVDKEQAEGSRETVDDALNRADTGPGTEVREDGDRDTPQGITNHPAADEAEQQDQLPPRGQRKGDVSA